MHTLSTKSFAKGSKLSTLSDNYIDNLADTSYHWKYDENCYKISYSKYKPNQSVYGEFRDFSTSLINIHKAIIESKKLFSLEDDWDDDGALPLTKETWTKATTTLRRYSESILTKYGVKINSPEINLCKDGSIDLEWRSNDRYIFLINILNKDGFEAHYYGEDYLNNSSFKGILKDVIINEDLVYWMKKMI